MTTEQTSIQHDHTNNRQGVGKHFLERLFSRRHVVKPSAELSRTRSDYLERLF
jgi:hypothetical protein